MRRAKEKLTKKQSEIYDFVVGYMREHGYAPSYREIGTAQGIGSTATVHEHVKNLERKGYLSADASAPGASRAIGVSSEALMSVDAASLPLKGVITAGEPIEAVETNERYTVPKDMVRDPSKSYVLRVKGESMIDDGILSGDYVVVEEQPSPRDGEIVVALLEGVYATLKRIYREKGRVRLQPANKSMKPFYADDVVVQGVVRGVIRSYRSAF